MYLVGREFAGSERGAEPLGAVPPFDLVVIDEAHEIFAGLHKRYDRDGIYDETSDEALMAHRVRGFLRSAPVLLLTATPMQNSLAELWGLVQYVEPTGTLLGDITTFREVFCADDDRTLVPGQEHELQRRLGDGPPAHAAPSGAGVPRPAVHAAPLPALRVRDERRRTVALRRCDGVPAAAVAVRLRRSAAAAAADRLSPPHGLVDPGAGREPGERRRAAAPSRVPATAPADRASMMLHDLEDEDGDRGSRRGRRPSRSIARRSPASWLVSRASSRARDPCRTTPRRARSRTRSESSSISAATAAAAARRWCSPSRSPRRSTCGSCSSTSASATRTSRCFAATTITTARSRRTPAGSRKRGATCRRGRGRRREVAVRLALVHEFRTRSKVLVCTEAGAKGLNLQFCETVINYDLPWNPQRIEQRIGRCHRYSQQRDVTVVNFIAKDNEAHRLTFEILSQKLDLFGKVLDASDIVLHEPRTDAPEIVVSALSLEFENDLRNIYSRSRTLDEVTREIAALRDKIAGRRDAYEKEYERTSQIIESRFDEDVRRVFKRLREELPAGTRAAGSGHRRPGGRLPALARRRVPALRARLAGWCSTSRRTPSCRAEIGDGRRFATGDAQRARPTPAVESAASAGSGRDRGRSRLAGRIGRAAAAAATPLRSCAALAGQDRRPGGGAGRLRRLRAGAAAGRRRPSSTARRSIRRWPLRSLRLPAADG